MSEVEEQLKHYYEYREYPTDSDEYQQSLDIYLTLRSLLKCGSINDLDVLIVESIISGYSFRRTSQIVNLDRRTVTARYKNIIHLLEASLQ